MMGLRAEADYGLKSAKRSREEAETGGEDQFVRVIHRVFRLRGYSEPI